MKKLLSLAIGLASLAVANPALAQVNNLDSRYLDALDTILVRNGNPFRNAVSEQGKIDDGVLMCQQLDNGSTMEDVSANITNWVLDSYSSENDRLNASNYGGVVLVVAVNVYCPEYRDDIDEYLERQRRN